MEHFENLDEFIKELKIKLKLAMPKIREEIKVYEKKLKDGSLTENQVNGPQFNG